MKSQKNRMISIGVRVADRPKNLTTGSGAAYAYGRAVSVAQARNVPLHSATEGDSGKLVIGLHEATTGYASGTNVTETPFGQVVIDLETAKRFKLALEEQIAAEERAVELEKPKFVEVTVRVPAGRATHPAHAKNLVQRALNDYYSENGAINGEVVGEARIVTGKDAV